MSHYAKIENGVVTQVIVAEQDFIDTLPGYWVQTSYSGANRKNYAGIGYYYDAIRDAFIPPIPGPEYTLNEETGKWEQDAGFIQWKNDIELALLDIAGGI